MSNPLEVPSAPPPNSRFILPPPPSALLNRLQQFLPQIKQANEQLVEAPPAEGEEEGVTLEFSDEEESSDEDSSEQDSSSNEEEEGGAEKGLAGLMDISARLARGGNAKGGEEGAKGSSGITELE